MSEFSIPMRPLVDREVLATVVYEDSRFEEFYRKARYLVNRVADVLVYGPTERINYYLYVPRNIED